MTDGCDPRGIALRAAPALEYRRARDQNVGAGAHDERGDFRRDATVRLDGPVLGASIGLTLLIGLGFALLPAWRGTRADLQLALKGGDASMSRRASNTGKDCCCMASM